MEIKDYVTNFAVGCCLGASSAFGSSYDISLESKKYLELYNISNLEYVGNAVNRGIDTSEIVDINHLEAVELISLIKTRLNLNIDDYFMPNKNSSEKITLFITCQEFKNYCENQQYKEALELEQKITLALEDKLSTNQRIARVAFL